MSEDKQPLENEDDIVEQLTIIRQGITEGNWELVCSGYNEISGEDLVPPVVTPDPPKSKKASIKEKLQEKLNTDNNNDDTDIDTVVSDENGFQILTIPIDPEVQKENERVYQKTKAAKDSITSRKTRGDKLKSMDRQTNPRGAMRVYDDDPRNS